jgi:hypothetical protein
MELIHMPTRRAEIVERQVVVPDASSGNPATLGPPSRDVKAAIEAGVVSRRMLFPNDGAPRTVETWRAPVIKDKAIGAAIWSRLTAIETCMAPASRSELMSRILVLHAHYRSTIQADAVEQGIADDWAEDLAAYPMWAVEEAARMWRRTRKFKPQISEMIELCEAATVTLKLERDRLRSIVDATVRERNPLAARTDDLARGLLKTIG